MALFNQFEKFLDTQMTTSRGDDFTVSIDDQGDIVYTDCYGDTLTWLDNAVNRKSIVNMIKVLVK